MQETLCAFFREAAQTLEEYQVRCQLMLYETDPLADSEVKPAFTVERIEREKPETRAGQVDVAVEEFDMNEPVVDKDPETVERRFLFFAQRTRRPFGQFFVKKMRKLFPMIPRQEILARLQVLSEAGLISDAGKEPDVRSMLVVVEGGTLPGMCVL